MSDERWETVRRQMNVDEAEVLAIRRLMRAEAAVADAEAAVAGAEAERRPSDAPSLADCLDAAQKDPDERADLYLATLARYAAARGGRIEVRAVLPDGPVILLSLGDRDADRDRRRDEAT